MDWGFALNLTGFKNLSGLSVHSPRFKHPRSILLQASTLEGSICYQHTELHALD